MLHSSLFLLINKCKENGIYILCARHARCNVVFDTLLGSAKYKDSPRQILLMYMSSQMSETLVEFLHVHVSQTFIFYGESHLKEEIGEVNSQKMILTVTGLLLFGKWTIFRLAGVH